MASAFQDKQREFDMPMTEEDLVEVNATKHLRTGRKDLKGTTGRRHLVYGKNKDGWSSASTLWMSVNHWSPTRRWCLKSIIHPGTPAAR